MTSFFSITTFPVVVAIILGYIFCGDVTNVRQSNLNAWPQLGNTNKNQSLNAPQWQSSLSTTPWPTLGQSRHQLADNMRNSQPMGVRPSTSPSSVRNTASNVGINNQNNAGTPKNVRGNSANYNTNFLNIERGLTGQDSQASTDHRRNLGTVSQNQRLNMGSVNRGVNTVGGRVPNQGMNNRNSSPNMPLIRDVDTSHQNNNKISPTISTGSKSTDTKVSTQDQTQGSNTQSDTEGVEDYELREFSEELLSKDINNVARFVTVNLQGKTTSRSMTDEAPLPLLSIDRTVYTTPSIEKLILLYNNYILETNQNEVYTAQEKIEENNLLDAILSTPVMQHTRNFLVKKGKIGKDPKEFKDLLRLIWFNMYSRGGGRIGSSGFEHVFLAELKNNQVSGLHNWLYFNEEEKKSNANYLGYMKKLDLGSKGSILKYHFTFRGVDKPVGSMFIGTSPELEIALYSTCFILRADRICPLKLNGNRFIIRTYTYRYRGKNTIGSAFPEI